jgi:hypothetical protein
MADMGAVRDTCIRQSSSAESAFCYMRSNAPWLKNDGPLGVSWAHVQTHLASLVSRSDGVGSIECSIGLGNCLLLVI